MSMMSIMGFILIVIVVFAYIDKVRKAYLQATSMQSRSMGIKSLKFQKHNPTWGTYVCPLIIKNRGRTSLNGDR
jgi:hypothetical protein